MQASTTLCLCLARANGEASQKTQPNIPLKKGFYLLLFSSSYSYLKFFVLIHAWIASACALWDKIVWCRQRHYFVPDETIDLFDGQKVVQNNFTKWETFWQIYLLYEGIYLVFVSYSHIFIANSIQNKVIMICIVFLHWTNFKKTCLYAIKPWTAKISCK